MDHDHHSGNADQLDYDEWRVLLRSICGSYEPTRDDVGTFVGWAKPFTVHGLAALDMACNAEIIERSPQDVRLDATDHCYAVFQVAGRSDVIQNDRTVALTVGDMALVDGARPVTYRSDGYGARWLSIHLSRQLLTAHLGREPFAAANLRRGTVAGQLLFNLVRSASLQETVSSPAIDAYMRLAVYDLLGALFAPQEQRPDLRHTNKLFEQVRGVVHDRFTDPDFGPTNVAREIGVSLRYLQKLFSDRASMCSDFIYSVRLDSAAKLLERRLALQTGRPLSEIAYTCGFRDYTHFCRKFHRRFGCTPGAYGLSEHPTIRDTKSDD